MSYPPALSARDPVRRERSIFIATNQDTYFRLHGTNEPETIGSKVSSGCIRLFNHDIIDLYNRAPVGTQVVVLQEGESLRADAGAGAGGYYDPYGSEPPGPYAGPPGPYPGSYYGPPVWAPGW